MLTSACCLRVEASLDFPQGPTTKIESLALLEGNNMGCGTSMASTRNIIIVCPVDLYYNLVGSAGSAIMKSIIVQTNHVPARVKPL